MAGVADGVTWLELYLMQVVLGSSVGGDAPKEVVKSEY